MAEKEAASTQAKPAAAGAAAAEGNPVFRMMGLPNFRWRLPSRNWMIFWTVIGGWTGAVIYDRQQKKRIQRKWCKLVEDLANEPMPTSALQRKLTVYIAAPPMDGLMPAREHFNEYIKPILVSAALDWDAIEGRREGDIRAGLAERIRKLRKMKGEATQEPLEDNDIDLLLEAIRDKGNVSQVPGVEGDIVVGRHTWKEYVRGLHEGWLGPIDAPPPPPEPEVPIVPESVPATSDTASSDDQSPAASLDSAKVDEKPKEETEKPEENKLKKKKQPPPFNKTSDYSESQLPPSIPSEFQPSIPVRLPHLLGFLNTPIRVYRFLNKRAVADAVGRDAAAAVFTIYRPYETPGQTQGINSMSPSLDPENQSSQIGAGMWEQEAVLAHEEPEWHKTTRKEALEEGELNKDGKERIWTAPMKLDERIAERMRRFELDQEIEVRAKAIDRQMKPWYWFGYGEKKARDDDEA